MKKLISKTLLFLLIIALADVGIGIVLDGMVGKIKTGSQGSNNYLRERCQDDILVFGSSRASHHYDAPLIEDSLGMTCYNCGEDGSGILLAYGRLSAIVAHHCPKVIIYDVAPSFDLLKGDNHDFLGRLKTLYGTTDEVEDIFEDVDPLEKYKMLCSSYRYNSKFIQYIYQYLAGGSTGHMKGFRPLRSRFDPLKIKERPIKDHFDYDSVKMKYLREFIERTRDAHVYFVVSPQWYDVDTTLVRVTAYQPLIDLCRRENIPFINFTNRPKYTHNDSLFKDGTHLNARGAEEFTKDIVGILKEDPWVTSHSSSPKSSFHE